MRARDDLAQELFIGDNFRQPREQSIADWEYFHAEGTSRGRVEHYEVMADAILAAGYSKPRTITTAEELDALPVGSVVLSGGKIPRIKSEDGHWLGDGIDVDGAHIIRYTFFATVIHEATL